MQLTGQDRAAQRVLHDARARQRGSRPQVRLHQHQDHHAPEQFSPEAITQQQEPQEPETLTHQYSEADGELVTVIRKTSFRREVSFIIIALQLSCCIITAVKYSF